MSSRHFFTVEDYAIRLVPCSEFVQSNSPTFVLGVGVVIVVCNISLNTCSTCTLVPHVLNVVGGLEIMHFTFLI